MKLQRDLLLFQFLTYGLGGGFPALAAALKDTDIGRRGDGQSHWFGVLEGRASRLRAPLDLDALRRYDLNILQHEATLAGRRSGFQLKFFQYLALLYAELFLDRLVTDRAQLLLDLEAFRAARFPHRAAVTAGDLSKLAFWMATGSGKTLLLHINYLQFLHYRPFKPANILLLAPSRGLADQHLCDLEQSGLPACHALAGCAGYAGIQVLEITKLYKPQSGQSGPRSGESLPTDHFEGPNLLLVDEGHKGTATQTDAAEERAWRTIREALAENGGFTMEYSATFAQVAELDPLLHAEYARCIVFDYAYRSFYADGYGKDYWVANLQDQPDGSHEDLLLMGGLLAFYQQWRAFHEQRTALRPYLIEPPLMVFIGDKVSAGKAPEVLEVIRFLDRVSAGVDWAEGLADRVLSGCSGLNRPPDGADCFADRFPYLRGLNRSPPQIVADLRRDLFQGSGGLSLHLIRRAEGEIGMRVRNSPKDCYCGVVNVGDAPALLKRVAAETRIPVEEDDTIAESLFKGLDEPDSTLAFLVGSKKFLEGWSSWRVSTMGLLKVGQNAGAQVLQLFGRGVRLKGWQFSLRRSTALPGEHPGFLPLLETLNIFGLRAKYLETFLNTLRREDLEPPVVLTLPIKVRDGLPQAGLSYPRVRDGFHFRDLTIRLDPARLPGIQLNLMPQLGIGDKDGYHKTAQGPAWGQLSERAMALLPIEDLYRHALAHKARKDWGNLYLSRDGIKGFLRRAAYLAAPPEVLAPRSPKDLRLLTQAARVLIEKGIDRFYLQCQRAEETRNAQLDLFNEDHPNVPRVGEAKVAAYELRVPPKLVAQVKKIIEDEAKRLQEDTGEPLPRLHLDQHIYAPLLLQAVAADEDEEVVKSVPSGLVGSERRFVLDLRAFWERERDAPDWSGIELFLMRNLPKTGIGFFQTGGFFPDFLLWMRRGDRQALAFVEPHGIVHQEAEKLDMLGFIRGDLAQHVEMPLMAFIVTDTKLAQVKWLTGGDQEKREDLRKQHVLMMDQADYLGPVLREMRATLA